MRARVDNADGDTLAIYRDASDSVLLEFTTAVPEGLERSSCPTFQVDTRTPQHYYPVGAGCSVDGAKATYAVATIAGRRTESLPLYRLMNGGRVAFRYQTRDGTYHESVFSLRASKQAVLGALGRELAVDPGSDE